MPEVLLLIPLAHEQLPFTTTTNILQQLLPPPSPHTLQAPPTTKQLSVLTSVPGVHSSPQTEVVEATRGRDTQQLQWCGMRDIQAPKHNHGCEWLGGDDGGLWYTNSHCQHPLIGFPTPQHRLWGLLTVEFIPSALCSNGYGVV